MTVKTASQIEITKEIVPSWLGVVQSQVKSLHFGVVQIVVHDSRVVQIERTERLRLDKSEPGSSAVSNPDARRTGDTYTQDQLATQHPA